MPPVTRVGDLNTGHISFPPAALLAGCATVLVNGIPAGTLGDAYAPHASPSPSPPHADTIGAGSSTVTAGGKPLGRIGDACIPAGVVAQGSANVFAGG